MFMHRFNSAIRGCDLRIQSDAISVNYMPLIMEDDREAWEKYSFENRFHIDEAYKAEVALREQQDASFGLDITPQHYGRAEINANIVRGANPATILRDGTGFHPKIWAGPSNTDEIDGNGPYLPDWHSRYVLFDPLRIMLPWDQVLKGNANVFVQTTVPSAPLDKTS